MVDACTTAALAIHRRVSVSSEVGAIVDCIPYAGLKEVYPSRWGAATRTLALDFSLHHQTIHEVLVTSGVSKEFED